MSETNMVGNENGILLWSLMSSSKNKVEKEFFKRLSAAASAHQKVWFSDIVTQIETNKNQTVWQMTWKADENVWEFTKFHAPEGAVDVTPRMKRFQQNGDPDLFEIDLEDLLL